jgi:hypothetical protein
MQKRKAESGKRRKRKFASVGDAGRQHGFRLFAFRFEITP